MAPKIPTSERTPDWAEQLQFACQTLSRSRTSPAMVIQVTGELKGTAGQAMPLLLMAKRLAEEYGLKHEGAMRGRVLSVRLSAADVPNGRNRI